MLLNHTVDYRRIEWVMFATGTLAGGIVGYLGGGLIIAIAGMAAGWLGSLIAVYLFRAVRSHLVAKPQKQGEK